MVDYCTISDLREYDVIAASDTANTALLTMLITMSSRQIDDYCNRRFYGVAETRYYHAIHDVEKQRLFLDEDLAAVDTITNGDATVIMSGQYVLEPYNETPKYGITLKGSSSKTWTYVTDPERAISVAGTWGYVQGTVPPQEIKLACIRLVQWRFKQKDAPFETVGFPDIGMVNVPTNMPKDVMTLLARYRKIETNAIGNSGDGWYGR